MERRQGLGRAGWVQGAVPALASPSGQWESRRLPPPAAGRVSWQERSCGCQGGSASPDLQREWFGHLGLDFWPPLGTHVQCPVRRAATCTGLSTESRQPRQDRLSPLHRNTQKCGQRWQRWQKDEPGCKDVPVAGLGALGGTGRAGAGKNQHSCDSHTLLPAQGWLPAASWQQLQREPGRESEERGLQVSGSAPSKVLVQQRGMLGPVRAPGGMSSFYTPALELGPFWHRGGSRNKAAAPAWTHPGRERPWPRCLCSTRCLAQTKAVATSVASVNRLLLSLAASRHLLLQPSTEQMPVWNSGGRETPELQYFTFLPTALPSWQRLRLDSHNAQTALPLLQPPPHVPAPSTSAPLPPAPAAARARSPSHGSFRWPHANP